MADLGEIAVKFGADTSDYESKMLQLQRRTAAAAEATQEFLEKQELAAKVGKQMASAQESAGTSIAAAFGPVGMALDVVGQALSLGVSAFEDFGKAAIDAANLMDPKGAKEYAAAQNHLQDTLLTVAGALGKELRPIVEAVTNKLQAMAAWALKIDFHKLFQDLASFGSSVVAGAAKAWEALKGFGDQVEPWADVIGRIMFLPADIMRNGFTVAIGGILDIIGKVASAGERLGVLAPGWGDAFKDASATVKSMGGSFYQDLKDGTAIAIKGAKDLAAAAVTTYASGPPAPIAHISPSDLKAQEAAKAVQKQVDAAKLANEQALAGMHAQDAAAEISAANQAVQAQVAGAKLAATEAHNGFTLAKGQLDEAYANGSAVQIAAAQQAVSIALQGEAEKGKLAVDAAEKAADLAKLASANADEAMLDARANMLTLEKAAQEGNSADAFKAATEAVKLYEGAQKAASAAASGAEKAHLDAMTEGEKIRNQGAQDAAAVTKKAAEAAAKIQAAHTAALTGTLTGSTGTIASAVTAGIKTGDPMAALADAAISIIGKSKGFTDLVGALNTLIDSVGGALGQLFEGLTPLISIISQDLAPVLQAVGVLLQTVTATVGQALAPILGGLQPLLKVIGQLLTAFAPLIAVSVQLALVLSGVGPELLLLGELLKVLSPLIGYLADGVKAVVDSITGVWNWAVGEVEALLNQLAKLPYVGDAFKDMASGLESMKVQTDTATAAVSGFTLAVTSAAQAAAQAQEAKDAAYSKLQALIDLRNQAQQHVGDDDHGRAQAMVDEYTKEIAAAQQAASAASLQAQLAADQQALESSNQLNATWTRIGEAIPQGFQDLNARLAAKVKGDQENILEAQASAAIANTAATQDNTATTAAAAASISESLGNLPQLYNLGAARAGLIGGDGTLPGLGGSGTTINVHVDNVTANDPEDLMKQLEAHAARANYRQSGTLGRPGGRNLTQP
jgi:hypothetical protein